MLESGDFVRTWFQDEPRHKKPAGIHWAQAASVALTEGEATRSIWPYRIPSLLGATLAVLMTFAAGKSLFDPQTAFLGAALLATSFLLVFEAHQATTDAALLATVVAAQGALGKVYAKVRSEEKARPLTVAVFWLAQGAGMLIKGPVTPLVSALTAAALMAVDRRWELLRRLQPWWGLPLALLIVGPWLVLVGLDFLKDAFLSDLLPKLVSGHESHGFPPGYYLLLLTPTFWPGSLFVWLTLADIRRFSSSPARRFCLTWLLPTWVVFEMIPTKLPHYVLPIYPALSLLTAHWILAASSGLRLRTKARRAALLAPALFGTCMAAGMAALPLLLGGSVSVLPTTLSLGAAVSTLVPLWDAWRGLWSRAAWTSMAGFAVLAGLTFQAALPSLSPLWLSRSVAQAVSSHSTSSPEPAVASAGYQEPSLVFLLGTKARLVSAAKAAAHLHGDPAGMAVVGEREAAAFQEGLANLGHRAKLLETVKGFNYTKGRWMTLKLYGNWREGSP
jgi:4-amino-4-deoxy-L-arabinose transferase-like glycosyltransferase